MMIASVRKIEHFRKFQRIKEAMLAEFSRELFLYHTGQNLCKATCKKERIKERLTEDAPYVD